MITKYSYKTKFRLLIAGFLVLVIACYELSFTKTFSEYRRYNDYLVSSEYPANTGPEVRSTLESVQTTLNEYLLDTLQPDKNLIRSIGEFCLDSNLTIIEYKPLSQTRAMVGLLTRRVVVQGSFSHCLQLVYFLEKIRHAGRVQAAKFWSVTDPKEKRTQLNCCIYIQNTISIP